MQPRYVGSTVALCRANFGIERSGIVFGWVFAAHMVGAGVAASFAGWLRESQGDHLEALDDRGRAVPAGRRGLPAHPADAAGLSTRLP